jgi:hypothetical protein
MHRNSRLRSTKWKCLKKMGSEKTESRVVRHLSRDAHFDHINLQFSMDFESASKLSADTTK